MPKRPVPLIIDQMATKILKEIFEEELVCTTEYDPLKSAVLRGIEAQFAQPQYKKEGY